MAPAATAHIPKAVRVVDATGKFLIPGLWDKHTHLLGGVPPCCPDVTFPITVAHGITGIREVGSYLDFLHAWREEVESGRIVGPRMVGSGPLIDGVPPVYPGIAIVSRTPIDARQTVEILSRCDADFVKAYEMLRRDTFFALVEQAKKNGLAVVAHVPLAVLAGEASDAGVKSFEHTRRYRNARRISAVVSEWPLPGPSDARRHARHRRADGAEREARSNSSPRQGTLKPRNSSGTRVDQDST